MALRRKWWALYEEAKRNVAKRDAQLAAIDATHISPKGMDFIAREEGALPYAYNDPVGHATFGVGHLIHFGGVTTADRLKWGTPQNPKPRSYMLKIFDKDLDTYEEAVRDAVKVPLKQHEFDALVSLAFNIGTGGFAGSSVVKRLNVKDRAGAADAIMQWRKPSVLIPRRSRERNLFLTAHY